MDKALAWEVRRDATRALGEIFQDSNALYEEGQEAVKCILTMLKDEHPEVRATAVNALGKMKVKEEFTIAPLRAALSDDDPDVRQAAAVTLAIDLYRYSRSDAEATRLAMLVTLNRESEFLKPVAEALLKFDPPPSHWPMLDYFIQHGEWKVRQWALETMGRIMTKPGYRSAFGKPLSLFPALGDKSPEVRIAAAQTIEKSGDLNVMDTLISRLDNEKDENVRQAVAGAIQQIGLRSFELLLSEINENQSPFVRRTFAKYMGLIGDSRAVEPLRAALNDTDESVRQAAAGALEEIAKKGIGDRPVVDLRNPRERQIETEAEAYTGLGSGVDDLVAELIRIGNTDGFRSTIPGGKFDQGCNSIRAREIGELLNAQGGMDLMQAVYYRVRAKLPNEARSLEGAWGYIGEWRP